jgi:hypothetical protein
MTNFWDSDAWGFLALFGLLLGGLRRAAPRQLFLLKLREAELAGKFSLLGVKAQPRTAAWALVGYRILCGHGCLLFMG